MFSLMLLLQQLSLPHYFIHDLRDEEAAPFEIRKKSKDRMKEKETKNYQKDIIFIETIENV